MSPAAARRVEHCPGLSCVPLQQLHERDLIELEPRPVERVRHRVVLRSVFRVRARIDYDARMNRR